MKLDVYGIRSLNLVPAIARTSQAFERKNINSLSAIIVPHNAQTFIAGFQDHLRSRLTKGCKHSLVLLGKFFPQCTLSHLLGLFVFCFPSSHLPHSSQPSLQYVVFLSCTLDNIVGRKVEAISESEEM